MDAVEVNNPRSFIVFPRRHMPELPEVETTRVQLSRRILGAEVQDVNCLDEFLLMNFEAGELGAAVKKATIEDIARHGKVLILRFSCGRSLLVHFRMTGNVCVVAEGAELPEYARVVFELADGRRAVYHDMRRLGTLELVKTCDEADAETVENIGPDALKNPPSTEQLMGEMCNRRCAIKQLLLDQRPMSGIGNVLASEILHRARIHPQTAACELTEEQVEKLLEVTAEILPEAIAAKGTTIRNYETGDGEQGGFQDLLRVYGREGEKCLCETCDGQIWRITQGNRSTYFCPACQKQSEQDG